jgi:hypothetical protein
MAADSSAGVNGYRLIPAKSISYILAHRICFNDASLNIDMGAFGNERIRNHYLIEFICIQSGTKPENLEIS